MPLRKDFIQRQLEEFGKVLAVMLGLKRNNDWPEFEKELNAAAQKYTGLELRTVENMSENEFETEVLNRPGLELDQKKILARLLFERLEQFLQNNNRDQAEKLKQRCLLLYTHIQDNFTENEFDLDVHYKIAALRQM